MATQRGICPVCGEERAVTAKGKIRQHFVLSEYGWRRADECPGTRQPAKSLLADPIAAAEQRGYQKAIDALRDEPAYRAWLVDVRPLWCGDYEATTPADYLEALATQPTDTTET